MKFKKIISLVICLGLMMTLFSGITASADNTAPTIVKLSDSSSWVSSDTSSDVIGSSASFFNGATAIYGGNTFVNELAQLKGTFNLSSDGWVGFKFRSDKPGYAPWDNSYTYLYLVRPGKIELYRYTPEGNPVIQTYPIDLNDGKQHEIALGAYDTTSNGVTNVNLALVVDGKAQDIVVDSDPKRLLSSAHTSEMSINLFGQTTTCVLETYADSSSPVALAVDREAPKGVYKSLKYPSNWLDIQQTVWGPSQAMYSSITKNNGTVTLIGQGATSYKNKIGINAVSFKASVKLAPGKTTGYTTFMLKKQNRATSNGDSSYGIKLYPNGKMYLIRYTGGVGQAFPGCNTGLDFTKSHTFTVEMVTDNAKRTADFYIYIDSTTKAYAYHDTKYIPTLQGDGFIGMFNSAPYVTSTISDVKFLGTELGYVSPDSPKPVYYADFFALDTGKAFFHWSYNQSYAEYSKVEITKMDGTVIANVDYPNNTYNIPDPKKITYSKVYLTALNPEGKRSEKVLVDLKDVRSSYYQTGTQERIAVKTSASGGKAGFVLSTSGKAFVPNGVNYIGLRFGDHATFEPKAEFIPAAYDPYEVETMLKTLRTNGYNCIRVFLSPGRVAGNAGLAGDPTTTTGIYVPYMENFTDLLKRAQKYGIYVMPNFSENETVTNNYFGNLSNGASKQGILFSQAGLNTKAKLINLVLDYVKHKDATLLNTIFALEMQNEFAFYNNVEPFSQTSGTYTFLDGKKYDMSNTTQRRALANAAARNYYATMKNAIKAVAPKMLMCEGTFTLKAVGKDMSNANDLGIMPSANGDNRFPLTALEYLGTDIDFLDMHIYRYGTPGTAEKVSEENFKSMQVNTAACQKIMESKPIIMGEYAGFVDEGEGTLDEGMKFAKGLQNYVMSHGFQGALYWTDGSMAQTSIWHLTDGNSKYYPYMSITYKPKK